MSPQEFTALAIGIPWRRWHASWEACDCYGLVVLWHREVAGIELGDVPHTDMADGFARSSGWVECGDERGATGFMSWRDGAPRHCGILLAGGLVLHSQEGHPVSEHGSVRVTRLAALRRMCNDIRFYRYEGSLKC